MKRVFKPVLTLFAAAVCLTFGVSGAFASGFGPYLQGHAGSMTWTFDSGTFGKADVDGHYFGGGLGVAFDTNCARDELVNYRVAAGFDYDRVKFDDVAKTDVVGTFGVDNFVGFGVYRTPKTRLWVGPEVKLAYFKGFGDGISKHMYGAEFGVGPAVGINMHLGRELDMALTTGLRYSFVNGTWRDSTGSDENLSGNTTTFYFGATFLFRSLDDTFTSK